jgi:hypothetical protein
MVYFNLYPCYTVYCLYCLCDNNSYPWAPSSVLIYRKLWYATKSTKWYLNQGIDWFRRNVQYNQYGDIIYLVRLTYAKHRLEYIAIDAYNTTSLSLSLSLDICRNHPGAQFLQSGSAVQVGMGPI